MALAGFFLWSKVLFVLPKSRYYTLAEERCIFIYQGQNTVRLGFAKHPHSCFIGTCFWVREPQLDDQHPGAASIGNEIYSSQSAEQGNAEGNQEGWGMCAASLFPRT